MVLMCEVAEEATYVRHHKKKIILLFSAMRHFADELRGLGWTVAYTKLDDAGNAGSFSWRSSAGGGSVIVQSVSSSPSPANGAFSTP